MAITLDGTTGAIGGTSLTATGAISAGSVDATTMTEGTVGMPRMVLGTSQATTSGTSIDFTGIPSWVKRITVVLDGVSTNGSSNLQVQAGSGSIDTTGYNSTATTLSSAATSVAVTTGFAVTQSNASVNVQDGFLTLVFMGSNKWKMIGSSNVSGAAQQTVSSGAKTLSGTLDRIRLTTVNGTDVFDAGSVNVMFEG